MDAVNLPDQPVLLVDGDIVAYRCAAAAEKTKYAVEDVFSTKLFKFDTAKEAKEFASNMPIWSRKELEPVANALNGANLCLEAFLKRFPTGTIQVYLSGERNFRDGIWQTKKYKGNRVAPKPTYLEEVRQHLISRWDAVVSKNQEADDDIGIASGSGTIVVSTDKDLDQIPGWHYNWVKEEVYYVDSKDAEQFLWEQVISGDPTDNIPGLPGWGPVKAREYMDGFYNQTGKEIADYVYDLFRKEGYDYPYFHEMVTLIKILREPR